jgi:PPOX class probable F420-dependent enzyme
VIDDTRIKAIVDKARVARLATVDSECKPHLIPVVFVYDNNYYFIPIDDKHKTSTPEKLRRTKNIRQNSNVVLLIDEYDEDWTKLYFIMIQGNASIIGGKKLEQHEMVLLEKAHKLLYEKYLQYEKIGVGGYVIKIHPKKVISWMNL